MNNFNIIRTFLVGIGIILTSLTLFIIATALDDKKTYKEAKIEAYQEEIERLQKALYECQFKE